MVFKRRNKLSWGRWIAEGFYPKSGWKRAASYVGHRLRRLPDTPEKIARGVGIGVLVSFTPLFGLHFVVAIFLAMLLRGNILAALLGTFFGNPVTFPVIATSAMTLGHWLLPGGPPGIGGPPQDASVMALFGGVFADIWHNILAMFTDETADWGQFRGFMRRVFLPYLIGGIMPGAVLGVVAYFLSRPLIGAYQKRRKGKLMERWKERRAAAKAHAEDQS